MWPPWARSPRFGGGGGMATASPAHPSSFFKSPSFKDIRSLLGDDDDGGVRSPPDDTSLCPSSTTASSSPRKPPSPSVFHRVRIATSALRTWRSLPPPSDAALPTITTTHTPRDTRVVLYFTSLRVVRTTFEDCRAVRAILRGFQVAVDERDVSMDARLLAELRGLLRRSRAPPAGGHPALPRVFIGGRCMGGADEIRQLHESGELKRYLADAPPPPAACELCGGVRFVLCHGCSGSHKRYSDKGGGGFRACASCNENGLVRCPECCGDPNDGI